jgi:acyl-CoA synthetase (AMP-forming)/AMP-acid ligase II
VKAVVVLKSGAPQDPADIIAWVRARVANFKAPKSVDFVDLIPRNLLGKILRRELREPYWKGRDRRVN